MNRRVSAGHDGAHRRHEIFLLQAMASTLLHLVEERIAFPRLSIISLRKYKPASLDWFGARNQFN
jgi:hypothetical protein